jgi:hypothetical protein
MTYRIANAPLAGPARSGTVVHVRPPVKLIFYPGDEQRGDTLLGHIYVMGGEGEVYEACGGPAERSHEPGHTRGPTPKGKYHLGPRHHHVTVNWSTSCIAYGAPLRQGAVEYEYQDEKGHWHVASGPDGKVTKLRLKERRVELNRPLTEDRRQEVIRDVRKLFRWNDGTPMDSWWRNDFGEWAWNLPGTACYIHTTPKTEVAWHLLNQNIALENSHGCIHIHPKDRDEMMRKGYLKQGAYFEVKGYSEKGPP